MESAEVEVDENSERIKIKPHTPPNNNIARNIAHKGLKLNPSLLRRVNTYNTYIIFNLSTSFSVVSVCIYSMLVNENTILYILYRVWPSLYICHLCKTYHQPCFSPLRNTALSFRTRVKIILSVRHRWLSHDGQPWKVSAKVKMSTFRIIFNPAQNTIGPQLWLWVLTRIFQLIILLLLLRYSNGKSNC